MKSHEITGVIQPDNGIYFLRNSPDGLIRITVCKKTLQVINEEFLESVPTGWTEKDVADLLDEGKRFFGED